MSASIWSYQDNFDWHTDNGTASSFYVELENHRGDYSRSRLLTHFNLDPAGKLRPGAQTRRSSAVLFGGHLGCGKSTELRKLETLFDNSYTVALLELTEELDINNLRFSDVLIVMAHHLVRTLEIKEIVPDAIYVKPVLDWFETRIVKQERYSDLSAEIETGVEAKGGIPFLVSLLAKFTAKLRSGASYREELRNEVRNGFTQLAQSFNALVAHANEKLVAGGKGPLLLLIDGTDKLSREDSAIFFRDDANQIRQLQTNLIVCAPIAILIEEGRTAQQYDLRIRLPMVKICDRDGSPIATATAAMQDLLAKRMPLSYFDQPETAAYLVKMCGGHPRDLLRLVRACFGRAEGETITLDVAQRAVRDVAAEYQRAVLTDDWKELVDIDAAQGADVSPNETRRRLLYDLVLLEYNNYWWASHPLVRELDGYKRAAASAKAAAGAVGAMPPSTGAA